MMTPATQAREIRVFLSSTFKDMEEERNFLLTNVFPRLRRICDERQVVFTEIDLRWGVSEESCRDGRTVEICLEEIDRCREYPPFFIGILGERYGWTPERYELEKFWTERSASPYTQVIASAIENGISATELEMQHGFMTDPHAAPHARIYLRAPELTARLFAERQAESREAPRSDFYDGANGKLDALKRRLRHTGVEISDYANIESFGEAVYDFLKGGIDTLFPAVSPASPSAVQACSHELYAWSRRKDYLALPVFRRSVLENLKLALVDDGKPYICIRGEAGLGKSAFIADLQAHLAEQGNMRVFSHYIGADGDRSIKGWRDRLLDTLAKTGAISAPAPTDERERWNALESALFEVQAALQQPLVLLLDALNQSSSPDAVHQLKALKLPGQVVIIASSTPELSAPGWQVLEMPALDVTQRRAAIDLFLATCGKDLAQSLRERLAESASCAIPLFMRLLLEELRLHARNDNLEEQLESLLHTTTAGALFDKIVAAMDKDFLEVGYLGLASRAMHLIAASRRGLRRADLAYLLATPDSPTELETGRRRFPDRFLSPLLARLEPYCLKDEGRFYMMHESLLASLLQAHQIPALRQELAEYAAKQDQPNFAESIYQLRCLEDTDGLVDKLSGIALPLVLAQVESPLLRDILSWLGAHAAVPTVPIRRLGERWRETIGSLDELLLPEFNVFSSWLSVNGFLTLQEYWLGGIVAFLTSRGAKAMSRQLVQPIHDFAALYRRLERWAEAEPLAENALQLARALFAENDPRIADNLVNLAEVYKDTGRLDKAELLYQEALALRKRILRPDDPTIASTLNCLASLHLDHGRYLEAEQTYREVLQIFRQTLPAGHPRIASVIGNLSQLYQRQGQYAEALALSEEELAMFRSAFGDHHHCVGISVQNLAGVYFSLGKLSNAEQLLRQALDIYRRTLPPNHSDIGNCLHALAHVCMHAGRSDEAQVLEQEAAEIDKLLPTAKRKFQDALNHHNQATIYMNQGQPSQAEIHYRQALMLYERDGLNDPFLVDILTNLSELCMQQRRLDEADALLSRALVLCRRFDLGSTPIAHRALRYMATVRWQQGRHQECEMLTREAIVTCHKALPDAAAELVKNLDNMVAICQRQHRDAEASAFENEASQQRRQFGLATSS
ncbi:tetratricopeptide repeat protein [Massilia sp. LXY-6]|uniref:tetratricopeptide repeat protein n=1 Tax=Massilia sp. LXY-6 TaxID=3379823 RepID=UPI003EE3783B